MKKYISMMAMAIALAWGFTACDVETDEEPGGTNIQNMCGNWEVLWYAIDADGNEEPWTKGTIYTYNMADNGTTLMWIDDQNTYLKFKFLVNINDLGAMTFSTDGVDYKGNGTSKAFVKNGQILLGQGKNLHGMPTDSIVFEIGLSEDTYPSRYGFDHYRVEGVRYGGFTE